MYMYRTLLQRFPNLKCVCLCWFVIACAHVCVCVFVYVCMYMCVCVCVCVCVHICINAYISLCIWCVYMYIICIDTYILMYTHSGKKNRLNQDCMWQLNVLLYGLWYRAKSECTIRVHVCVCKYVSGKTGVTADRDKIEFRLFNSSSIFNMTLREDLFSSPKQNQPCCLVLVSWRLSPKSSSLERSWRPLFPWLWALFPAPRLLTSLLFLVSPSRLFYFL